MSYILYILFCTQNNRKSSINRINKNLQLRSHRTHRISTFQPFVLGSSRFFHFRGITRESIVGLVQYNTPYIVHTAAFTKGVGVCTQGGWRTRACQDFPFLHAGTIIMIVNFMCSLPLCLSISLSLLYMTHTHTHTQMFTRHCETFHIGVPSYKRNERACYIVTHR